MGVQIQTRLAQKGRFGIPWLNASKTSDHHQLSNLPLKTPSPGEVNLLQTYTPCYPQKVEKLCFLRSKAINIRIDQGRNESVQLAVPANSHRQFGAKYLQWRQASPNILPKGRRPCPAVACQNQTRQPPGNRQQKTNPPSHLLNGRPTKRSKLCIHHKMAQNPKKFKMFSQEVSL